MKEYIKNTVKETLEKAGKTYNREFKSIPVDFDLKGKCAGQFCFMTIGTSGRRFRFNIDIADANGKAAYKQTVVHEVAHYVTKVLNEGKYIRPHGTEWKSVMTNLGVVAKRTHNYTIPSSARSITYYKYKCDCRVHDVSIIIHNKIRRGGVRVCRHCRKEIVKC